MIKIIWLTVLLFISIESRSQELDNLGLAITNYKDNSNELLLKQLNTAHEDSNKIKLLVRICSFYWYERKIDDSILYYSKKAIKLAERLHYNPGYYEACFLQCKINAKKGDVDQARTFIPLVSKNQQARLLLVLGEHYLFLPGEQKNNLDSAYPYFNKALLLSETIQDQHWKEESLFSLGKYYFSVGEINKGKESIMKLITYYHENGDKQNEVKSWNVLAEYIPDTDSTYSYEIYCFEKALQLFYELKDTIRAADLMFNLAEVYRYHAEYDSSKQKIKAGINLLKLANQKRVNKFYYLMSMVSQHMGDLNESLFYALEALKNMEEFGDTKRLYLVYYQLGGIYALLNQHENSLKYFLSAKDKINDLWLYHTYANAADQLIQLQKPREALKLLIDFDKELPAVRLVDKETMAAAKADCYAALHEYNIAERFYVQMIALDELAQKNRRKEISPVESICGPEAYYKIGKFYVEQKKYKIANSYFARSLQTASFDNKMSNSTDLLRNIRWMQFKADSATGNYVSALQNFQKYTAINDSMFNTDKIKQVEKMRLAFETTEKEKNIQLLEKEKLIQQGTIKQATLAKNVAIAGILLLLIITGLLYRQFRLKQLNNKAISYKNETLGSLLSEKEWLLKEVHHRVKNNLQIIISLLNTQSNYLKSDDAVNAIRESQERMQAISLIHQKLYKSDESAFINIREYVHELIDHIRNGFSDSIGIVFELNITDSNLDVAQAVPLGLILNEAVSNIFKYAFPGKSTGKVVISITHSKDSNNFLLTISDNGTGIPQNYDVTKKASFGIRLMQGLSKQMGGSFNIENDNGVKIEVAFRESKLAKLISNKNNEIYALQGVADV
ncbi:sensor histidine kinase [Ferruginibacter paludis]|uniref:tetratricopeptide repeat-containing sensor histidine kinase n=1 Tax=Ferruginibacter paludis TaxID=1310417 RepID=UPI0025B5AC5F|nr:sensor histidine kinase [Ferruginibacter paludis]MDN3656096.1 sensor histidine kinase [Ferruginibacter paludis]